MIIVGILLIASNACTIKIKEKHGKISGQTITNNVGAGKTDSVFLDDYDPDFRNKLSLTAKYEKNMPDNKVVGSRTRASVKSFRGLPAVHINDHPVYFMMMMPSPYVKDEDIVKSSRDFAAADINLYSDIASTMPSFACKDWWLDEKSYDFTIVDRRLQSFIDANPNALVILRIKLDPPGWWMDRYPDDHSQYLKDGKPLSSGGVSMASVRWENAYEHMLRHMIRHIEGGANADHIIGYLPAGGISGEWYWYGHRLGFVDYSPAARERFRKWLKEKYVSDLALQTAWKRKDVTISSAMFPDSLTRRKSEYLSFRDPRQAAEYLDARQFLIDMTTHNVIKSCAIVKEETGGNKLAGVFYGYSLLRAGLSRVTRKNQWGDLANNGQSDLYRVLSSPVIDFITTPPSYGKRRGGDPGNLIGGAFIYSMHLHNKFFIDEEDIRTHLFEDKSLPYRTSTLDETISVLHRASGWSLTKGNGIWWFLLAGNHLFHQEDIMQTVKELKKIGDKSLQYDKTSVSEVAFFADEVSLNYLADDDHPVVVSSMWNQYERAVHMGTPFDFYILQDIAVPNLPDYKVYVFLNTYYTTPELRKIIAEKVRKNNAVAVWIYAPGFVTNEGLSEEAMRELTGITIKHEVKREKSALKFMNTNHPITAAVKKSPSFNEQELDILMGPRFWADDESVIILGESEGRPALVVKEEKNWRSVYSAFPLTKELLQGICDYAGVHVYNRDFDVFFANRSYMMVHAVSDGLKEINLPANYRVTELITGKKYGRTKNIKITLSKMDTRIFHLEEMN